MVPILFVDLHMLHMSSDQSPGYLLYIKDYSTELYRDYKKLINIRNQSVQRNVTRVSNHLLT